MKNVRALALGATILCVMACQQASANELINNNASGSVKGSIAQQLGANATGNVYIGALNADYGKNNTTKGHVGGSVSQYVAPDNTGTISVGSIDAAHASNNVASGSVGGSIHQHVADKAQVSLMIGGQAADADPGYCWFDRGSANMICRDGGGTLSGNKTHGHVGGDIIQLTGRGAVSRIHVGSVGSGN